MSTNKSVQSSLFFEQAQEIEDEALIVKFLDYLIYLNSRVLDREETTSLVKKYAKDFMLPTTSWGNIAIANMELYEQIGAKKYKEDSIKACEHALDQSPGYGTAQAVKLIICAIDYERGKQAKEKESSKMQIVEILKEVNSGSFPISSDETCKYLHSMGGTYKKYVDSLLEIASEQMKEMEERRIINVKN